MSERTEVAPDPAGVGERPRRPGELTPREMLRWAWRQLTSMRTALVLLLLLALAAVPGSVVPQEGVDSLATSRWRDAHPTLAPVYERLGLFSVYDSPWFSAIYLLLMVSLVGCFVPRLGVYWRTWRAAPPATPRRLERLPDHTAYHTDEPPDVVLARAAQALRRRRYRVVESRGTDSVRAERGHLREAGNLLFHVSVLVVLVGFAAGSLLGYRGGVILVVGSEFTNNPTQYDEFEPGGLFDPQSMEPFSFDLSSFDEQWLYGGPRAGMAQRFLANLAYQETPGAARREYDLRVNHPLAIGGTEVFLIGHGYAPVITVRDGNGDVAYRGATIFLPTDQTFRSFGVVKAPDALPTQIGLEGEFYPTYDYTRETGPFSAFGEDLNPLLSMLVYTGDLGMDDGRPQSVYVLDKKRADLVRAPDGGMFRVDLAPGQSVDLPGGLGSVSFDRVERWTKLQISRTPGKEVALAGVLLALLGLMGSLFVRSRRVWVRARPEGGRTVVQVAGLDRSGGGDVGAEIAALARDLRADAPDARDLGRVT